MQKLIGLILLVACANVAHASDRIKDGRQYTLELARRFKLDATSQRQLMISFREREANLPKESSPNLLAASLNTMAKVANQACTFAAYWEPEVKDVSGLYVQVLDRPATADEIRYAIRNRAGQVDFFSNCMVLALHPDFIYQK